MKRSIVALMLCLLPVTGLRAEDPSKMELAIDLVSAMDYCSVMARSFEDIKKVQIEQMKKTSGRINDEMEQDLNRTFELIRDSMDCESMTKDVAAIYAELFTADELKGLAAFYRSEVGRRYSELLPEITRKSMLVSSARINAAMPAIMLQIQQEKKATP